MINTHNLTAKSLSFVQGFKNFIARGNVLNLAVAVVIGQLFSKIVSSLVADIIMPPFSLLFHRTNTLKDWKWQIKDNIYMNYGLFLQNILEFFILAFVIYAILTVFSHYQTKEKIKPKSELTLILESLNKEIVLLEEMKTILTQTHNKS
ncbi:large conductance mechanosensitive channel protein MscL [Candidatus Phytoplasma solani]|uniref:large conductance mechanosensitive channel protein MscL n=1 Tax=Candidatus Phytoplasma solani TaxID=69896 RepID=UPI0003B7CB74|nr:large conductance mechanosensitive channel protein MscL [Candidatus Phytoplasma solani]CCP88184.1 Large-conductance mechanosensitive channel [Candidatus Phytoplasma solani]CCP88963.1 Large-conductance mechanosensitive channel [Candidatus Phytoplasma solani]